MIKRTVVSLVLLLFAANLLTAQAVNDKKNLANVQVQHVFILMEENHGLADVIGNPQMPYFNSLLAQGSAAYGYFGDTHPSIGNYFMLTTGQIITNNDGYGGTVSVDNVVRELLAAGKTWKEYSESIPFVGYTGGDSGLYAERHNPCSYFGCSWQPDSDEQPGSFYPIGDRHCQPRAAQLWLHRAESQRRCS